MPSDKSPALDFGQSRTVKGRGLALPERLRAARGVPQAIVKVASFAHGPSDVMGQINYISRKGKLALETESGEELTSREQIQALVQEWSGDFDRRKDSRDSVHLVFSMPHGSDPEALRNSVRKVLHREFPDQEAVFAIHQDTRYPHAHVVMKMRGREKKTKLALKKEDLHRLREVYAEAAREEGVELAVSPRAARGVGRKGLKQAAHHLRQRKAVPTAEKETARNTVQEIEQGRIAEKPWEKAMRTRNRQEREAYRSEAEHLRALAVQRPIQRAALLRAADDLERYSETMPAPKTLRQTILDLLTGSRSTKPSDRKGPQKDRDELSR